MKQARETQLQATSVPHTSMYVNLLQKIKWFPCRSFSTERG
jgi:hypothetical protein